MSYNALAFPKLKWFDSNGDPATGWLVYTYEAGTTTAKTSYSTPTGTANANPVVLNANGEADIYLDGSYKIVMKNASDVTQWTLDNVQGAAISAVVFSVVASAASLGTGTTDGEGRITVDDGNYYTWDSGGAKWRIMPGNRYTTAALPASSTYTIETGIIVFDTTTSRSKYWTGSAWVNYEEYRVFYIPASAFRPCTTNPCSSLLKHEYGTNDIDLEYLAFDSGATPERAQVDFKMPEDWDCGMVKAKFDWTSASGSTAGDTCEWSVKAGAFRDNVAIDSALGSAQVISDVLLADNGTKWQTTPATPAITIGGTPALTDTIIWEVSRNGPGADNMTEDAWFLGLYVQYKSTKTPAAW